MLHMVVIEPHYKKILRIIGNLAEFYAHLRSLNLVVGTPTRHIRRLQMVALSLLNTSAERFPVRREPSTAQVS